MWKRHLLFFGLVCAGIAALLGALAPRKPASGSLPGPVPELTSEELATVARVDQAFHAQWRQAGLKPAPLADHWTVIRRLSLGLMGTIPSLEAIRSLERLPPEQRSSAWLHQAFQDRRYADYLAERLARAFVGTEDGPFVFYRRRRFVSWLSDQLLARRPYDALVRDLIADEGLWTDKPATNFITVTYEEERKGPNPERLAARVARAFLGVRLDCAQCHDHPFQPWKQDDFQSLAAYFGQVENRFTGIHDGTGAFLAARRRGRQPEAIAPRVPLYPELVPTEGSRRQRLAAWITHPANTAFARVTVNRLWALLLGRPLVMPVDDLGNQATLPPALDLLAQDFTEHGYDLQRLFRIMAATEVFRLASAMEPEATAEHEAAWAVFPLTRLRPDQVAGALAQAASLTTIDSESPLLVRFFKAVREKEFIERYGDLGQDEFEGRAGTIPQRLLLMNGQLVYDETEAGLFNAAAEIALLAPDDANAIATAYWAILTRAPSPEEAAHFARRLSGKKGDERKQAVSDLCWTLVNATEFSWNH